MKRIAFSVGVVASLPLALLSLALLWACTGDDEIFRVNDAGVFDAAGSVTRPDRFVPEDGGVEPPLLTTCGDSGGAPVRALIVQGIPNGSELAALNLVTGTVDGRLAFDGGSGVMSSTGNDPYLVIEDTDIVTRLDPREPWKPVASWNVRGDDGTDADAGAHPVAVVPVTCSKAYVLRYNRDRIAIIDQSQQGGVPSAYIDLTPYKVPGGPNVIGMMSAVYIPSKKKVFVLLGNTNLDKVGVAQGPLGNETNLLCTPSLKPSIIAIDVDTDKVVSLGGTAPGGGVALDGYNPAPGRPLVYDASFDRLLVLSAGCNEELDGGGVGAVVRRRVEQVALATGAVKTLIELDEQPVPTMLALVDGDHAAIAFHRAVFSWDPHQSTLGAMIDAGVDLIAADGRGGFFGTRGTLVDGGPGPFEVVSIPIGDAGPSVAVTAPFSQIGGSVSGIDTWPRP